MFSRRSARLERICCAGGIGKNARGCMLPFSYHQTPRLLSTRSQAGCIGGLRALLLLEWLLSPSSAPLTFCSLVLIIVPGLSHSARQPAAVRSVNSWAKKQTKSKAKPSSQPMASAQSPVPVVGDKTATDNDRRIYIRGTGAPDLYLASCLAMNSNPPPITLLMNSKRRFLQFPRQGKKYTLRV